MPHWNFICFNAGLSPLYFIAFIGAKASQSTGGQRGSIKSLLWITVKLVGMSMGLGVRYLYPRSCFSSTHCCIQSPTVAYTVTRGVSKLFSELCCSLYWFRSTQVLVWLTDIIFLCERTQGCRLHSVSQKKIKKHKETSLTSTRFLMEISFSKGDLLVATVMC